MRAIEIGNRIINIDAIDDIEFGPGGASINYRSGKSISLKPEEFQRLKDILSDHRV